MKKQIKITLDYDDNGKANVDVKFNGALNPMNLADITYAIISLIMEADREFFTFTRVINKLKDIHNNNKSSQDNQIFKVL